jgi:hypothetical protein
MTFRSPIPFAPLCNCCLAASLHNKTVPSFLITMTGHYGSLQRVEHNCLYRNDNRLLGWQ